MPTSPLHTHTVRLTQGRRKGGQFEGEVISEALKKQKKKTKQNKKQKRRKNISKLNGLEKENEEKKERKQKDGMNRWRKKEWGKK